MTSSTNTPNACHVMAKPSSSKCNIDCSYCFYLEKQSLYPQVGDSWKMDLFTLECYVKQQIEAQVGNDVIFAWQGGEPTLMGLDFYRAAISFQLRYNKNKKIINTFQTNGLLINEEWCLFFKEHQFLIGISIDGPAELHNRYRKTRSGKSTHHKVVDAITLLKKHHVQFNTLTVVSEANAKQPLDVYRYLKELGSEHMQFIPLIEREAQQQSSDGLTLLHPDRMDEMRICDWSVEPEQYGLFMSAIFREWVREDVGKVYIQLFENTFALTCKQAAQICVFAPTCGSAFALESNGDIYACDHYVYPEFKLGNIHKISIKEINQGKENRHFALNKQTSLSQDCLNCEFLSLCNGGCPKHRFALSSRGIPEQNYLCHGYKTFFSYSKPYMNLMKELHEAGYSPAAIMQIIKQKESQIALNVI